MENLNERLAKLFPEAYQEELTKLQKLYDDFNESCRNFTTNVMKNCNEKFEALKNDVQKEAETEFEAKKKNFINNNPILWLFLMQGNK